jgi:hypothetical protein
VTAEHSCPVDWLFESGPADPAWLARVRAEFGGHPVPVGRPRPPRACADCGAVFVPTSLGSYCRNCQNVRSRRYKAAAKARRRAG